MHDQPWAELHFANILSDYTYLTLLKQLFDY